MLRAAFDAVAARQPEAVAMVDRGAAISYSELGLRSGRLARILAERAGLQRGDRLAVCLPNCWEFAAGALASAGIGGRMCAVPTCVASARDRVARLAAVAPRSHLARRHCWRGWRESGAMPATVVLIDEADVRDALLTSTALLPPAPEPENEPCLCFTTSGSTGRPRIVFRSARNLISAQQSTAKALGLGPGMRQLSGVPFLSLRGVRQLSPFAVVVRHVCDPAGLVRVSGSGSRHPRSSDSGADGVAVPLHHAR